MRIQGELTMCKRQRSQAGRLLATSSRAIGREANTVVELPEAEKNGKKIILSFKRVLLTNQHLATTMPRSRTNYLDAVGEII